MLVHQERNNVCLEVSYFLVRQDVTREHSQRYVTEEQRCLTKKEPAKSVHYFVSGALG